MERYGDRHNVFTESYTSVQRERERERHDYGFTYRDVYIYFLLNRNPGLLIFTPSMYF